MVKSLDSADPAALKAGGEGDSSFNSVSDREYPMTRARSGPAREVVLDAGDGGHLSAHRRPRCRRPGHRRANGGARPLARAGHGGGLPRRHPPRQIQTDARRPQSQAGRGCPTGADTGPTTAIFTGTGARPDSATAPTHSSSVRTASFWVSGTSPTSGAARYPDEGNRTAMTARHT